MYNKTIIDVIFDAKNEIVSICSERAYELLATVFFMILIPWGRKFWLHVMHMGIFVKGIAFLIAPGKIMSRVIALGELDDIHLELIWAVGLLLLMWALSYWLLSKSTDSTIVTSYLWIMAIWMTCLLICSGYVLTHPSKKGVKLDTKSLTANFYVTVLFTLGTYYYAMQSNDWAGYAEVSSHSNLHLRLDFVILMMTGVWMFALPQWALSWQMRTDKIDSLHAYLVRACAAVTIAMGLMAGRSANFLRGSDKHCVVLSHLLYYMIAITTGYYYRWDDVMALPWKQAVFFAFLDLSTIINAMGALNFDLEVLDTVKTRAQQTPQDLKMLYADVRNMIKLKRF